MLMNTAKTPQQQLGNLKKLSELVSDDALKEALQKARKDKDGKLETVDLWVRAGSDGLCQGADPVCQQVFMVLLLKAATKDSSLKFNVKTVNTAKPCYDFKHSGSRHVPALIEKDDIHDDIDGILEFIDSRHEQPSLQYFDPDADESTEDVFSKFAWFIKEVNKDAHLLENELKKINDHMVQNKRAKFLCGNQLTHLDCRIAPALHHIRIACAALKSYNIPAPSVMPGLWRYLSNVYASEEFAKTCPADQEIVLYWAVRADTPTLANEKLSDLQKQKRTHTLTVPE